MSSKLNKNLICKTSWPVIRQIFAQLMNTKTRISTRLPGPHSEKRATKTQLPCSFRSSHNDLREGWLSQVWFLYPNPFVECDNKTVKLTSNPTKNWDKSRETLLLSSSALLLSLTNRRWLILVSFLPLFSISNRTSPRRNSMLCGL